MRSIKTFAVAALCALLTSCGGGGGDAGSSTFGTGSGAAAGGSSSGGVTLPSSVALALQLLDANGQPTTSLLAGQPLRARATLTKDGQPVVDEIVTFSLDQAVELARVDPVSGSILSDVAGVASVNLSSLGSSTGAGRIVAAATVSGVSATAGANFFASGSTSTSPSSLTLSGVEISSASVSAYGTTGLRVRVLQNAVPFTSPVTVNFTTSCAAGKATVTQSATTQPDGYAVGTFVDNGCAPAADTTVTVTASISTDSKSASFTVLSPTAGSLRFLSVIPSDQSITLRGQGGAGRQENATVTFQLVDVAGQGVGNAEVCFDITTYIGDLNLDGFSPTVLPSSSGSVALCGSDPVSIVRYVKRTNADGTVSVQINAGTVPTPVRVRARTIYPSAATVALETLSDTLSVSTGLPLQRSFSLSADKTNIDGGNFDGEVAKLTARLADQFSNPVPDGTVVNFIASGAAVCTANNGSCKTTNGSCTCDVVSQDRRPQDHRVVVMAYAVGLEDFDDNNGDNVYTLGTDAFDDLGDAYVDSNKDGVFSTSTINEDTDIPIPFQLINQFKVDGDLVRGVAHLRDSVIIYLSLSSSGGDPTVVIPNSNLSQSANLSSGASSRFIRLTPSCPAPSTPPQTSVQLALEDGFGNPMAAGTTLAVVDSTDNVALGTIRPANVLALGARPPIPSVDSDNVPKSDPWLPSDARGTVVTGHSLLVKGVQDKCAGNASFALELASPRGSAVLGRVLYEGEPRTTSRHSFDVRYVNSGLSFNLVAGPVGTTNATLIPSSWVASAGRMLDSYTIDWGDGSSSGPTAIVGGIIPPQVRAYGAPGTFTATMVVTDDKGTTYSRSGPVTIVP